MIWTEQLTWCIDQIFTILLEVLPNTHRVRCDCLSHSRVVTSHRTVRQLAESRNSNWRVHHRFYNSLFDISSGLDNGQLQDPIASVRGPDPKADLQHVFPDNSLRLAVEAARPVLVSQSMEE